MSYDRISSININCNCIFNLMKVPAIALASFEFFVVLLEPTLSYTKQYTRKLLVIVRIVLVCNNEKQQIYYGILDQRRSEIRLHRNTSLEVSGHVNRPLVTKPVTFKTKKKSKTLKIKINIKICKFGKIILAYFLNLFNHFESIPPC